MPRIEESIDIAAAPAAVFQFCHDVARRSKWDERVVRIEQLSSGSLRRGTLVRVDAGRSGAFLFTWDAEYAEFQFPSHSMLKVLDAAPSSPFKTGNEIWQFSSTGGGTRFTVVWEYQPRGFFARLGDALGQRAFARLAMRRSLAKLKALIEAG